MQRKSYILIAMILVVLISMQSHGEQTNEQSWRQLAQKERLSENAIEKLAQNNVVITDMAYLQIFTPYVEGGSGRPDSGLQISLFITTDSLINAYHVLYEESILRLENTNANKLEEILKFVLSNLTKADDNIKGNSELVKAANERAYIVVGTAMKLMDESFKIKDSDIARIVSQEVEKAKQATAIEKPSWLGEPSDDLLAIDYSRYKPRGFYTSSEKLSKYFRAVSWLQSIPFRLDKDDELLSILMLGNCLDSKKQQGYTDFFSTFKKLIGSGDDWDVITAKDQISDGLSLNLNKNDLKKIRQKLEKKLKDEGGSQINDQIRLPPDLNTAAAEPQFRFISAYRTPDAVLFHRTTDLRGFIRPFPNALEVCAALGSEFAKNKLEYSDKAKLLKTIDDTKSLFSGDSLYLDYLQCLACLLDEPPAKSPAFMKNETWQAKSCNTTLAGWSQLRHTWALQAKQTAAFGGISEVPSGFVEPEQEFYKRMTLLAEKTKGILERAGAFNPDYSYISQKIRYYAELYKNNSLEQVESIRRKMSGIEFVDFAFFSSLMYEIQGSDTKDINERYSKEQLAKIEKIAHELEDGKPLENERIARFIQSEYVDIKSLWEQLTSVSEILAKISKSELEGKDLKEYDSFIKNYGAKIGNIMVYGGNTYYNPKDDAMRIVDVYSNAFVNEKNYLHAGIGRARAIYVLYPWQGSLVLCKGAVMPYYEFRSDTRLTDTEWKELLDSPQRPDAPDWIKPSIFDSN